MPATMKTSKTNPAPATTVTPRADDGTRTLLLSGFWILISGILAGLAMLTVFGGISNQGPHTNAGWLAMIVFMMNCPFGLMLFVLGAAKWLKNRRMNKPAA